MTDSKRQFPRALALIVAEQLKAALEPCCERIEIVGSLRRGKESVGDLELLFVPRTEIRPVDMFAVAPVNLADEAIAGFLADGTLAKRLSKIGVATFGPLNKLCVHVASGIPVDLFSTTPENWFMSLVIRTGPTKLNLRLISGAAKRGYQLHAYGTFTHIESGLAVAVKSEEEVFMRAGLPYLQPQNR